MQPPHATRNVQTQWKSTVIRLGIAVTGWQPYTYWELLQVLQKIPISLQQWLADVREWP